jgi:hypothetical protein
MLSLHITSGEGNFPIDRRKGAGSKDPHPSERPVDRPKMDVSHPWVVMRQVQAIPE